jgi:leucyl-tRNA synthetase
VWDEEAIKGCSRFLKKAWRFCLKAVEGGQGRLVDEEEEGNDVHQAISECVSKVSCDIEKLRFNTAISAMMVFLKLVADKDVSLKTVDSFVTTLYPFAPHFAEEIWSRLGHDESDLVDVAT